MSGIWTLAPESLVARDRTALRRMPVGHAADPDDSAANVTYGWASALAPHHVAEHLARHSGPINRINHNVFSSIRSTALGERARTHSVYVSAGTYGQSGSALIL